MQYLDNDQILKNNLIPNKKFTDISKKYIILYTVVLQIWALCEWVSIPDILSPSSPVEKQIYTPWWVSTSTILFVCVREKMFILRVMCVHVNVYLNVTEANTRANTNK